MCWVCVCVCIHSKNSKFQVVVRQLKESLGNKTINDLKVNILWRWHCILLVWVLIVRTQMVSSSCTGDDATASPYINLTVFFSLWIYWGRSTHFTCSDLKKPLKMRTMMKCEYRMRMWMWKMDKWTSDCFDAKSHSATCIHPWNHTLWLLISNAVSSATQNISRSELDSAAWPVALLLTRSIVHSATFGLCQ